MKYNILVTGGAGYLGSILAPNLLELGHNVTVLDNFMYRQNSLMDCCGRENFNVVNGDARDSRLLSDLSKDKDIIIPLAALVGAPLCDRDRVGAQTVNRDAVKTLTEIISRQQRMIIPISNSGYGIGQKDIYCTEETPLKPVSFYGKTKVEAENIAMQRGNCISLRLATVFGVSPRMRIDLLVNDFTYRAVKDRVVVVFEGHFKRNYIHVRDVARAFIHAMDRFDSMKDEVYNVGLSDANLSKIELCREIKKQLPHFIYIEEAIGKDPDKRDYIVSNAKIEATGFKPAFSLQDGIKELIKGYTILNNNLYGNI